MNNPELQIIVNDMSDDASIAASSEVCEKAGILEVAQTNKGTGMIYFINANTKEVISSISVTKPSDEIAEAFEEAVNS
jgi:hypothetical protein